MHFFIIKSQQIYKISFSYLHQYIYKQMWGIQKKRVNEIPENECA